MQCGLAIDDDGVRGLVPRGWANRHKAPEIVSNFLRMLPLRRTPLIAGQVISTRSLTSSAGQEFHRADSRFPNDDVKSSNEVNSGRRS